MRAHALAAVLVVASATTAATSCGETLPAPDEPYDASSAESSSPDVGTGDVVAESTAADADAGCDAPPCNVEEVTTAAVAAIGASTAAMVWLEANTVFALEPGKAPITLMQPDAGGLATGFLAIDNVTVVMGQGNGVRRCLTTSKCPPDDPGAPIFGITSPGPIALGGGEIFVADLGGTRRLVSCGLTANCNASPAVVAYLPDVAKTLALTTSSVVVALGDQTLRSYLRSGRLEAGAPAPAALVTLVDVQDLATEGGEVYWADGAGGTIGRCTVASCAATAGDLATNRAFPRALAVSGPNLYWIETDADAVVHCTLPACIDVEVIARVRLPSDLAVSDRVYVASESEQKIWATALR